MREVESDCHVLTINHNLSYLKNTSYLKISTLKVQRIPTLRLPVVGTLKGYSKALEYEYRVKIAVLSTLKRYSIISFTLYLEWYSAYSIVDSGGPTS
jgi:hypothetical protein